VIAKRWILEGIIWEDGRWLKLAQGCVQWLTFASGVTWSVVVISDAERSDTERMNTE
jgi:hypothetical protein